MKRLLERSNARVPENGADASGWSGSVTTSGGIRELMNKPARNTAALIAGLSIAGSMLLPAISLAASVGFVVSARSNIFDSGHRVTPEGPVVIPFAAGPGQFFTFADVDGTVTCCASNPDQSTWGTSNGPDGSGDIRNASGTTDILSLVGISGIKYGRGDTTTTPPTLPYEAGKTMFLAGVFLDDLEPQDPAPVRLDFTTSVGLGEDFSELGPVISQTFFIGDGLTGTGTGDVQRFLVPETATRLFLGFADALQFGFPTNSPCCYSDNFGELTGSAALSVVPLPPAAFLFGSGMVALGAIAIRRRMTS